MLPSASLLSPAYLSSLWFDELILGLISSHRLISALIGHLDQSSSSRSRRRSCSYQRSSRSRWS
jgi:hypothetical protein